jgi:hypothetical protein
MSNFKFAQPRPLGAALDSQAGPLFSGSPFQDLPTPTGQPPYRLDLADVLPDAVKTMNELGGMIFHITGDTGGVLDPAPQLLVANGLQQDAEVKGTFGSPAFLYHMGDVIYFDGQAAEYYPQFYRSWQFLETTMATALTSGSLATPSRHSPRLCAISVNQSPESIHPTRETPYALR